MLLTVLPLWLVPRPPAGADGQAGEVFGGADTQAQRAIGDIAPGYTPWFQPLFEPASNEIASLLFALQAAFGAGVIGYWLGASVTREKMRKAAERQQAAGNATTVATTISGQNAGSGHGVPVNAGQANEEQASAPQAGLPGKAGLLDGSASPVSPISHKDPRAD